MGLLVVPVLSLVLASNAYLDEARQLYKSLQYQKAEAKLWLAREVPNSTVEEKVEANDLLARCLAAQGRMDETEQVYADLLELSPNDAGPEGAAPKLREAFFRAKEKKFPKTYVRLTAPSRPTPGQLEVSVADPWQLVERVVLVEGEREEELTARPLFAEKGTARYALPEGTPHRYFFEARGKDGSLLARLPQEGTLAAAPAPAPHDVKPPPGGGDSRDLVTVKEETEPKRPRWPAWATAGAAAGLGGAGLAFRLAAESDSTQAGKANSALETQRLDASARSKAVVGTVLLGAGAAALLGAAYLFWTW